MWIDYTLLGLAWLAYGLIHSALATSTVKRYSVNNFGISDKVYRIFYNVFAIVTLIPLVYVGFYKSDRQIFEENLYSDILGAVIFFIGLFVMILIIKKYFAQMSGASTKIADGLHIDGLHRYVRHPLYLGTFLLLLGILFYRPQVNVLISTIIIILYTIFAIRWEEQKLLINFGAQYSDYSASTPRIIPRFFAKRKNLKIKK
jgi:protein-S-isoprenylcysteine O-methyltransferase Ste14